jgi:UDP-N-acetyl-D-galactosamine dehydrogenase
MSLIRNARQINENKPLIVAEKIKNHIRNLKLSECAKILLLGFSYKPNSGDIRNTKVAVVLNELTKQGFHTDCFDPLVNNDEVLDVYGLRLLSAPIDIQKYDLVVVMVEHDVLASTILACDKKNIIKLRTIL